MGRIVVALVLVLVFQIYVIVLAKIDVIYASIICDENNFHTEGSVYDTNLGVVLKNLSAKSDSLRFYSYTYGDAPNQVYGLFHCRIDSSHYFCGECVRQATREISGECPFIGEAILWYERCMVRYSHRNILSLSEKSPVFDRFHDKIGNYSEFAPILKSTMTELIKKASSAKPPFSSNETNWILNRKLYTFAECTPDIDNSGCNACLIAGLSELIDCCDEYVGAMVSLPSCQLRYDTNKAFLGDLPSPTTQLSGTSEKASSMKPTIIGAIAAGVLVGLVILAVLLWICIRRREPKEGSIGVPPASASGHREDYVGDTEFFGDTQFVQYDFSTLKSATRDFSAETRLGEGGFGTVYKGTLENGEQLAIKRLSTSTSGQGSKEFMAEASLLAKLRHRNLVKLLGFCLEGDEKLLVYEFMSNGSLDTFLFDPKQNHRLNWTIRYKIIKGIARGLQYLHEDSPLTIIHRDLKPGNILLDEEMNVKIADFGLAKLFDGAQKFASTKHICGTIGYMAPEYLTTGEYSDKSDVYSFGIMLLEILSGQNNVKFYELLQKKDLPVHAWLLWNQKRSLELIDPILHNNCSTDEVTRCVQIGLLCLQANAEKRLTMAKVAVMLTSSDDLPLPSTPAMSFPQFNMPMDFPLGSTSAMSFPKFNMPMPYSGDQQTDTDQFSVMSVTQDMDPTPR